MANLKNQIPAFKKNTPTNYGKALWEKWMKQYNELIAHYPKWTCLEMIAKGHQVNRSTVEYHLFPQRKNYQKNFSSKKWAYEKADPEIHQKRIDYKKEYMWLRRHIDQYIEQAYQCTPLTGSLTLDDMSRNIELQTGIALAPDTILGLNRKYQAKNGNSLIENVPGHCPNRYRMNLDG